MSDLVKRLKVLSNREGWEGDTTREAAEEIERLRDLLSRAPSNNCDITNECYDDCARAWYEERDETLNGGR